MRLHPWLLGVALGVASTPALAHLELTSPVSRYGRAVLKDGPCGQTGGQRTTNVTVLRPGATLEVAWNEYINHPGYFRIAFDEAGDDSFRDPVCTSGCDGRTPTFEPAADDETILLDDIPDTRGGDSVVSVTLPDVECDTCTLQVIQVMFDKPPQTSPGNDIYYQCADLVLSRDAADAGPVAGDAGETAEETGSDDGGCSLSGKRSRGRALHGEALLAALALVRRRARRGRRLSRPQRPANLRATAGTR